MCSKGSALGETLDLSDRILYPEINGQRASWDEALDAVAQRLNDCIREHGRESIALYVSGQLLTEDYYVANKLMKGFVGTANIDTNSRLCMSSSVAGHIRAFGSDTVPGTYEDIDEADLVVLVGSNLAWCHPVLFQRLMAAREKRGTRIVVIDPRRTVTAEGADLHLPLAPNSDVALFLGLLEHLERHGLADASFIDAHTNGCADALAEARVCGLDGAAEATGLSRVDLMAFYSEWASTERVVTVYSQGVNQSVVGTDKVNAIINCHLFTARIGKVGMGPFSVTGQPNAMGGREVGGLATMLAAHFEIGNPEHRRLVRSFWGSPRIAETTGTKAVELFQGVADGRIKAVWIISTNPVDSMPEADLVRSAIAECPCVVVSDITRTDTTAHAHILLPATGWGEKSGTVTNSERRISRQRTFLAPPGEAKPDWWIICEVAKRMGFGEAFSFASPAEIFRELAALSALDNGGARDYDLSALATMTSSEYDALAPVQWPQRVTDTDVNEPRRFFADGSFYTPDQRARFVRTPIARLAGANPLYPMILNTGRIRDQWHTMTRTAKSPRLSNHVTEPCCEIHPEDAEQAGIISGGLVRIENERGSVFARAIVTTDQQRGSVFVPMHWTDQFAARGRVGVLATSDRDPVSGQPGLKLADVKISPFEASWYGFAVLRERPLPLDADYWALARTSQGWRVELAGASEPVDWSGFASRIFDVPSSRVLSYLDTSVGHRRFAAYQLNHLTGVLFVQPRPICVSRNWIVELGTESMTSGIEKLRILSGHPAAGQADTGAVICACFGVGIKTISRAIENGATTLAELGEAVRAGTNCGSCRAELQKLILSSHVQQPAA
ncbi:MAG: nitrate reductase [Beijerinckiaceae bacterium]